MKEYPVLDGTSKSEKLWSIIKRLPSLMFGLFLFSVGILFTLYSDLGMAPWDVLHMGIVNHTTLTLGQVSIVTGLVVLLLSCFLGVMPGLGSVLNMIFIGLFIDLIEGLHILYTPDGLVKRFLLLFAGIFIIGWGTFFYLRVNLGAGPRDSLMVGLVKKSGKPVWLMRTCIEGTVLIIGYFLGGPVGIGTVIIATTLGFSVQFAFRIGKYSSDKAKHLDFMDLYHELKNSSSEKVLNE